MIICDTDVMIDMLRGHAGAETAVEAGYPLYTFNQKHYQPHPLLKTIQPYSR